jgi:L-asparaginase
MKVLFIQTGGTIDKDYPKKNSGYAFEIDEPAVERILARADLAFEYEVISLFKKDSLDITSEDRAQLKDFCLNTEYEKIIITHGSDTLVETAKAIGNIKNKTILLTASYRPERFANSDADFNLGTAIGALNTKSEGTFIAMNGIILDPAKARKNPETGKFESF